MLAAGTERTDCEATPTSQSSQKQPTGLAWRFAVQQWPPQPEDEDFQWERFQQTQGPELQTATDSHVRQRARPERSSGRPPDVKPPPRLFQARARHRTRPGEFLRLCILSSTCSDLPVSPCEFFSSSSDQTANIRFL